MSGGGGPSTAEVPAEGLVATVIDLVVPPDAVPARITHRIDYTLPPDAHARALIGSFRIDGPELDVDSREAVVLMDVAGPSGPQTGTHPLLLAVADFR